MNDPYAVLELSDDADSEQIRRRYLELVRQYSPERAPEKFGEIRAAYDQIRDPVFNLKSRIFNVNASQTMDGLAESLRADIRDRRIPTDVLCSLARP